MSELRCINDYGPGAGGVEHKDVTLHAFGAAPFPVPLCARCAAESAGVVGKVLGETFEAVAAGQPRPEIAPEHVERVCKPGKPGCCAYLASVELPKFFCAKGDHGLRLLIQARLRSGTLGAKGDNCAGPPGYGAKDAPL